MSNDHPEHSEPDPLPGEVGIPILSRAPTQEELRAELERNKAEVERKAESAYKDRQLGLTKSNVDLARWSLILTFVLAIFTAVGAGAAAYQGWVAHKNAIAAQQAADAATSAAVTSTNALKDSELSFRTDERAWVELGKIELTKVIPADPPFGTLFSYSVFPINVGKTVARDVRVHIDNTDADGTFNDNQHGIRMSQDQEFHEMGTGKRVITPNKPGPETLAPGNSSPVPIYTGGQEPRRNGNGFRYTFILGRIDYLDAFETRHWKRFCYMISNSEGKLGHCQYGNDEDKNPEAIKPF